MAMTLRKKAQKMQAVYSFPSMEDEQEVTAVLGQSEVQNLQQDN